MEIFSDAIIAISMTIMVLELHVPEDITMQSLRPLAPIFFSYVLSFFNLALYWNNHHHLLHAAEGMTGAMLWANLHFLFWLSLVPFSTAWVGNSHGAPAPAALYSAILFMSACAYSLLVQTIRKKEGEHSKFAQAIGNDYKGKISIACYALAIISTAIHPFLSYGLIILVALMWCIPDTRLAPLFDHDE